MLTVRDRNKINRNNLVEFLEANKIGSRLFFGGNMIKQPAYININKRIHGTLENSDYVMNNSFWIGVWPGLDISHLEYMHDIVKQFVKKNV